MKKSIIFSLAASALILASCNEKQVPVIPNPDGTLSFSNITIDESTTDTKATSAAGGNYTIIVKDSNDDQVVKTTYSTVIAAGGKISLPEGNYVLYARSTDDEAPIAAFEQPVYGVTKVFAITSGKETHVGDLVCTLVQCKVTVGYNDDFLKMVTGDGKATVTVTNGYPLEYELKYNGGTPTYDQSAGYFALPLSGATTTMVVGFTGYVDGKKYKMKDKSITVEARQWHQIKIVKKVDAEGNAVIDVVIDDLVEDQTLNSDLLAQETVIGTDPKAPTGDGGIKLESTCSYDISKPITIPALGQPFVLTMKCTVPNKVKKFTVDIDSTNPAFTTSVKSINDGSTTLDLVNPSSGAITVFTTILPFPYGDAVKGKDNISFDLSDAQGPLLAFQGTHSFVMNVTDEKGCKKSVSVVMVVE